MKIAKVHRPAFDALATDHPWVTLTAKVTHGSVMKEFDLKLKVKMLGITDSQAIILDLNALSIPTSATENITLPTSGKNGTKITWASDKTNISIAGVVTRPDVAESDATVKLTATCVKGTEPAQTKEFIVAVAHWTQVEEIANASSLVNWDLVKGINTNSQAITNDLVLPTTIGRSVTATWSLVSTSGYASSTKGKINISTGVVTRPTYTQGQVTFQIACKLTKGADENTVVLPPFIMAPDPMTNQEVLNSAMSLLESSKFLGSNVSLTQITADMQLPFRLNDPNASRAAIVWSLVTASTHSPVESSPYIELSNTADYCFADVTRPTTDTGNISIGLKADITVGYDATKAVDVKYFDLTILAS